MKKTYGIFIAYPPVGDLRAQGLGRYMGNFAKTISADGRANLVVAAPSWSRKQLSELFEEMGVPENAYTILGPRFPPLLVLFFWFVTRPSRPRKPRRLWRFWQTHRAGVLRQVAPMARFFAGSRNPLVFLLGIIPLAILGLIGAVLSALILLVRRINRSYQATVRIVSPAAIAAVVRERTARSRRSMVSYLYAAMHEHETSLIIDMVNARDDVEAWYVPTAFWPNVTAMKKPHLICVPDVVVREFATEFSKLGANLRVFSNISDTLATGRHFVTYSEHVKQVTLVNHYGLSHSAVSVVPHASSSFADTTRVTGFSDSASATRSLNRALVTGALSKATGQSRAGYLANSDFTYIFYASQYRPSKNILSLLRAYKHLLRRRFVKQKLILTAHGLSPAIYSFVEEHDLGRDVLCLSGLSEMELAACYSLADLAVCPSLSEGGMPFTFTEALSVGTPVVMGDIEVTREIIVDPELREATLFDPYDWRAMADKIEWALNNRDALYTKQRRFYDDVLSKRTWEDVVGEHIAIMDQIAARERETIKDDDRQGVSFR